MSDYDDALLREGMLLLKVKEFTAARRYLERAADMADDLNTRVRAFYCLSEIATDPVEKRRYLEEVLAIEHNHAQARRALAILDGKLKVEEIVDPDNLPQATSEPREVKADRFTCPKCGGRMVFAADGQTLVCEYCQRNQALPQAPGGGKDFLLAMATLQGHSKPTATQVFQCRGCGADFILPPQTLAATCAYCGSNHVIALEGSRSLVAPDAIVPLAFDRRGATQRLVHWVEGNALQPEEKVIPPLGLYLPVWSFTAGGEIPWKGVQYHDKKRVEVSGRESVHYHELVVPASSKLSGLEEKILPSYDLSAPPAYDPRYLAGWPAEVYDVSMSDAALEARRMAVQRIREEIVFSVGDVYDMHYSPSNVAIESFQLVLIPVWMTTVKLEGRSQRVLINGQNGIVHGETPSRGILNWFGDLLGGG